LSLDRAPPSVYLLRAAHVADRVRTIGSCGINRRCRRPSAARSGQHGAQPPDTAEQLVLVPVRIRQAKVAAMRAHAAALRPCRDLRNSTAEQPSNRGLKRFQYPVVVRGSSPVEIEANDSKVLEVLTPESEHWRGLQLDLIDRLLIRRSLVRAQVGEPIKSKGYVARRNPFLVAILESGSTSCASSLSPIATLPPLVSAGGFQLPVRVEVDRHQSLNKASNTRSGIRSV
jgi:hypothetical protein